MTKHLFIMGCDRSGTTALVHLLNAHPKLCIGMERYKRLVATPEHLTPALFRRDEFFDIRSEQTNIRWEHFYKPLAAKYDHAAYVGDKVPRYFQIIKQLRARFPQCTLIFLARDPYSVARSWKHRATNPEDSNWPESHGAEHAIKVWNQSLVHYRDAAALSTADLIFLRYETIFANNRATFAALLQRLGLEMSMEADAHFSEVQTEWERKSERADNLTDQERTFIETKAKFDLLDFLSSNQIVPTVQSADRKPSAIVEVPDALLMPIRSTNRDSGKAPQTPFVGGVLDADGVPVTAARLNRFGKSITSTSHLPNKPPPARFNGRAFFGGYLFAHYGHFLIESLSRLWAWNAKEHPVVIFIGYIPALLPWQRKVLDILGVNAEIEVTVKPIRVDTLVVAEPGLEIGGAFLPAHNQFLSRISCEMGDRKLWLSRSGLESSKGGVEGEADFENELAGQGWTIFHPQRHSIEDQLNIFSESARIAGWEGSAFHTLLLLKDCSAQIDIFVRRASSPAGPQYQLISERKELHQRIHSVPLRPLSGKSRSTKYQLLDDRPLREVLMLGTAKASQAAPKPAEPPASSSPRWSPRRINTLATALSAKRYLEIGVHAGRTFKHINIEQRDGVDPRFVFDAAAITSELTRLLAMTSDEFFQSGAAHPKYDVIFIDGLHTFEQSFRDFVSCLSLCHDTSVILLDDTMPSDIFSALRDPNEATKLRAQQGRSSKAWHGDVYKVVFAIHDFFPLLDFATMTDHGNPQTLVWKAKRTKAFRPQFNSLEAISRLTYSDFLRHQDLMNPVMERVGLDTCISALRHKLPTGAAP